MCCGCVFFVFLRCGADPSLFLFLFLEQQLKPLNRLEALYISALKWELNITQGEYAKYYFALRSMNERRDFRSKYVQRE